MAIIPEVSQIKTTVARMEKRYSSQKSEAAQVMWVAYLKVRARFEADLVDERDIWLSRAAALMMLKYQLEAPE